MVEIIETTTPYFVEDLRNSNVHLICGDFSQSIHPKGCRVPYMFTDDGILGLDVMEFSWRAQITYEVRTMYPILPLTVIPTLGENIYTEIEDPHEGASIEWVYKRYMWEVFKLQEIYCPPKHLFFDFSNLYSSLARAALYYMVYHSKHKINVDRIEVLV